MADPRLGEAIGLFNQGEWYACHDGFEALWHETAGPMRPVLQGILQVAVAELHLERGNHHGATILMGEGLGRLAGSDPQALGVDCLELRRIAGQRLAALQAGQPTDPLPLPKLVAAQSASEAEGGGAL